MNSPPDVAQIFHLPSTTFRNNMLWGTQPCYFRVLHTIAFFMRYTTLLFLGSIRLSPQATDYMVYTPVISGPHTPNTGIFSSLSCWHHLSHENQLTEHSCFHDDHASPQALIPVIPSVLAFRYLAKSGAAAGVGPAPLCVCCQDQLRCGPHSHWRRSKRRRCR